MKIFSGDNRAGDCARRGYGFEDVARRAFEAQGYETRPPANDKEAIQGHVDFWAKGKDGQWHSVDAKALKKKSRSDASAQSEWTFLEWRNNAGYEGWLLKGAEFMCFELDHEVLVIKREKLRAWAEGVTDLNKRAPSARLAEYCTYSRPGRSDLISMARLGDLPIALFKTFPKS